MQELHEAAQLRRRELLPGDGGAPERGNGARPGVQLYRSSPLPLPRRRQAAHGAACARQGPHFEC
jgi:hypothetical protein